MYCVKCNHSLSTCTCSDLNERLESWVQMRKASMAPQSELKDVWLPVPAYMIAAGDRLGIIIDEDLVLIAASCGG